MINVKNTSKMFFKGKELEKLYFQGALIWRKLESETPPITDLFPVTLSFTATKIAASADGLYLISGSKAYKYDLNGKPIWEAAVSGTAQALCLLGADIYVGTSSGRFYKLNSSGAQQFNVNAGQGINDLHGYSSNVFLATQKGVLKYDTAGIKQPFLDTPYRLTFVTGNGVAAFAVLDETSWFNLVAVGYDGSEKWGNTPTVKPTALTANADGTAIGFSNGKLTVYSNAGSFGFDKPLNGSINCIDATDSAIYVGTGSKIVYKLDAAGNTIWQKSVANAVTDVSISGSYLYVIHGNKLERIEA